MRNPGWASRPRTAGPIALQQAYGYDPWVCPRERLPPAAQARETISQLYASPLAGPMKLNRYSSKFTRPWTKIRGSDNSNAPRPEDLNIFEEALNLFVALETKCAKAYEALQQQPNPEDESCPICDDVYNDYYKGRCPHNAHFRAKTLCGHAIGYSCLEKWHLQKAQVTRSGSIKWSRCPMCRAETTAVQPFQSPAQIQEAKQLKLRRQIFLAHEKIANAIRGALQWIVDFELTEECKFTIAAAIVARIFLDYWADGEMGPTVARKAVQDVAEVTREIIKL